MGLTIKDMKIGSTLVLGKYGVRNDFPEPIMWWKASQNGDFITAHVIDYLPFDVRESDGDYARSGNPHYKWSNINSFLNSDSEVWYSPTHRYDVPPSGRSARYGSSYESHYGFLCHFDEYEIEHIKNETYTLNGERITSQIRLPRYNDIFAGDLPIFARRGIRPKATEDMLTCRHNHGLCDGQFSTFWQCDNIYGDRACYVARNGASERVHPSCPNGIRPVCTINLDTPVIRCDDGTYRIEPCPVRHNVYDDDELFALLGVALP